MDMGSMLFSTRKNSTKLQDGKANKSSSFYWNNIVKIEQRRKTKFRNGQNGFASNLFEAYHSLPKRQQNSFNGRMIQDKTFSTENNSKRNLLNQS